MEYTSSKIEPPKRAPIVLVSKKNLFYTGFYLGDGQYRIVSSTQPQDDGTHLQFTTFMHSDFVKGWSLLNPVTIMEDTQNES